MTRPCPSKSPSRVFVWLFSFVLAALATACEEPLDFERQQGDRGTFGEELHEILLRDLERSPERARTRADVFARNKATFVQAVDATMPDASLSDIDEMMIRMMPLYDDAMIPDLVRKIAILMDEAADDPALLAALARQSNRPAVIADPSRDVFLGHVTRFDQMQALNEMLAELVLAHDGEAEAGTTESDAIVQLVLALSLSMQEAEVTGDPERFAAKLADLLLTEDPAFAPMTPVEPAHVVRVDSRGLARVAAGDVSVVPFPFADTDRDGLADVDANDHFVSFDGAVMDFATPFGDGTGEGMTRSELGRLRNSGSATGDAFEYVDLHQTALGFLLRESTGLVEQDVPFDMLRALDVVLGERVLYQDEHGSWQGFGDQGELVALTRGLTTALDHDDVPAVLEGLSVLMREHPDDMATVLRALDRASEIADRYPNASMSEDAALVDDLLPLVREILDEPGMLEEIMVAMDDPVARRTGDSIALLMKYKNDFIQIEKGGPYDTCFHSCKAGHTIGTVERYDCIRACPNGEIFASFVDPAAPESPSNRSLFQRTQNLMWESVDWPYEVGITELMVGDRNFSNTAQALGAAMIFEDLAEAYLLTLLGELRLEDVINPDVAALGEPLGLDGATVVDLIGWITRNLLDLEMDPVPTTDQVTRFFNKNPLSGTYEGISMTMNASVCRSGHLCIDAHADTLLAVEASGLADTLVPLVRVFHAHGKTDLLARIFSVMFTHYPSRGVFYTDVDGNALPFPRSDLRALEPMLIEILEDGSLLDALADQGPLMAGLELADGSRFMPALERHLGWALAPDPSLTLLDGSASTTDPAGKTIAPLSPAYLLLTPLRDLNDTLEANPDAEAAWERATGAAADLMLQTVDDGQGGARFARPGGPVLAAMALDELRAAWLEEHAAGTRSTWLRDEIPADVGEVLTGRALYAGVELFRWIDADPARVDLLRATSLHAIADVDAMSVFVYQLLVTVLDEVAGVETTRFFGRAIDPRRTWEVERFGELGLVRHLILLLDATMPLDPDAVMLDVMANAMQVHADGQATNIGRLWTVIRQTNRAEPGSQAPLTAEDYASMLHMTAEFMRDDQRGMERLYDFVEFAMYGPDGKETAP